MSDTTRTSNDPTATASDDASRIKDPSQWTTGDEPMTGAQESYLNTLARRAGDDIEVDENLTKAQASELIDELRQETGMAAVPTRSPGDGEDTVNPPTPTAHTKPKSTRKKAATRGRKSAG